MREFDPAVRIRGLDVRFGDFYAVKNVSFEVNRGEIFGFLGANGAGKTTTIRVLCGLLVPTAGEIEVAGEAFSHAGFRLKMKVGYMSQKFTLYEDLTVGENLKFAAAIHHLGREIRKKRESELLEFIGWNRDLHLMVRDLPGGQKQQVSLVAALMHDPEIVFLDEPTAGVSPAARARFWELIQKLADSGKTVFVTTHYLDEAEQCDRVALMKAGELVALDSPENLKTETFPNGLFAMTPSEPLSSEILNQIRSKEVFSLFEPYGLRFHAEWKNSDLERKYVSWISSLGQIEPIRPSLEDVFIRIVEGVKR